jgi:hypothetical protein
MGVVDIPHNSNIFGLVFQRGILEVWGVMMKPIDLPEPEAERFNVLQRIIVAAALPFYLQKDHLGVIVPCPYYKEKADGLSEAGIAFFVGPDASSKAKSQKSPISVWEQTSGEGASAMIYDMAEAISQAMKNLGMSKNKPYIGIDMRPRLMIGSLAMRFAIKGQQVFVIKCPLDEREPIWENVVSAGFSSLL